LGQRDGVPPIRRATVIVLEENAAVQELIDQALRETGHRVLGTNNTLEALEILRRVHVDILIAGSLLDQRTEALLGELRSSQAGLHVVSIDDADVGPSGDGRARLSNPISLEELTEAVAAEIERENR
jgi:DNA-binding NtrC family response regulator